MYLIHHHHHYDTKKHLATSAQVHYSINLEICIEETIK